MNNLGLYSKYLIFMLIIFYNFHGIYSCGCYGSASCTLNGTQCNYQSNESCLCDCCLPCNTCEQFLKFNCLASRYIKHYTLSENKSDIITKINVRMKPEYIIDERTGGVVPYLWDPCLRRLLPNGIYLKNDNNGKYKLIGVPKEKLEKTYFEILFKGPVSQIVTVSFTITIL
ncbi:unnamed protein product [Rotaria socialis]|uniref:Uncharacterized protein n=1 Tax=Rotaria socialis TaxID=392032 RepID=A0A817XQ28_9BILA|nr:unnamed protein product [Rotaria socialis]CAF3370826.1 unnamed protein product [Rotaria socialis]CAF3437088.1 unnamed protein product [Rotaria socialis]CAF4132329.1 unnamed protein product [Rotaria socialis]CAF4421442.1 unnamed protein product [Rotaria socialis]